MENTGPPEGAQAADAAPEMIVFAMEMAGVANEFRNSPSLTGRERVLWNAYLDSGQRWEETCTVAKCSKETLSKLAQKVKDLMLHPTPPLELVPPMDEDGEPRFDDVYIDTPLDEDLGDAAFKDVETSFEKAAKTANRVVDYVSTQRVLRGSDLKALEGAVRMLAVLRKSEQEYLKNRPNKRPSTQQLHEIAKKNKVGAGEG